MCTPAVERKHAQTVEQVPINGVLIYTVILTPFRCEFVHCRQTAALQPRTAQIREGVGA